MKRRVEKINQRNARVSGASAGSAAASGGGILALKVIGIVLAAVVGVGAVGGVASYLYFFGGLERVTVNESEIGLTSEAQEVYADYTNIALFGLDTRTEGVNDGEDDEACRSDAIMILSIDNVHNKIKLISIARDSYVEMERTRRDGTTYTTHDKLTHAWVYGKHQLALKTVNQNLKMDITDFVSMNFWQFAEIIDYIGGVDIDVSRSEMNVMNETYIPYINSYGIKCDYITKTGMQHLSGGQALAYARNRYTGTDIERGSRQREVMMAAYEQVKNMNKTEYVGLVKKVLDQCATSLSNGEMVSLATWALTKGPTFEELGLPTTLYCETLDGISYVVYDMDEAADEVRDFIHETGKYAPSSEPTTSETLSTVSE
ncbi:MAG: LCP family protein [Clostridia bacterium]|nr:LCP family protein [Clostridia bacterium]